jgi:hypothetical protein
VDLAGLRDLAGEGVEAAVGGGAADPAGVRVAGEAYEPEVGEHDLAVGVDQHVVGLEVAVHEARGVDGREPASGLHVEVDDLLPGLAALGVAQGRAADPMHDDVKVALGLAGVVDRDDVRVGELGEHAGLAEQPDALGLEVVGVVLAQDLDRDLLVEVGVATEEDRALAPAAEHAVDGVLAQQRRHDAGLAHRLLVGAVQGAGAVVVDHRGDDVAALAVGDPAAGAALGAGVVVHGAAGGQRHLVPKRLREGLGVRRRQVIGVAVHRASGSTLARRSDPPRLQFLFDGRDLVLRRLALARRERRQARLPPLERRQRPVAAPPLLQLGDAPAQRLEAASEPAADGGHAEPAERHADLRRRHVLEVVEVDRELLLERHLAQRLDQLRQLLTLTQRPRQRGPEVRDAGDPKVQVLPARASTKLLVQLEAGDGEQIGAKARPLREAAAGLDAAEEGVLDQVRGVVAELPAKEAEDRVEVALEQQVAGPRVAGGPALEELLVALRGGLAGNGHHRQRITPCARDCKPAFHREVL